MRHRCGSSIIIVVQILLAPAIGSVRAAPQVTYHAQVAARTGEMPRDLLGRVALDGRHLPSFLLLNHLDSAARDLESGRRYRVPAYVHDYVASGIRFSLDIPMVDAIDIRDYNRRLVRAGVKRPIADDREFWVPYDHVLVRGDGGTTVSELLHRYGLGDEHLSAFNRLNDLGVGTGAAHLKSGEVYRLPIHIVPYGGPTIRQALGVTAGEARRLAAFNGRAFAYGLKPRPWDDHLVWRPYRLGDNPDYGPIYRRFEIVSDQLAGCVFHLSPGHGGPDPGTSGRREGVRITEDEYVMDISLRLARELQRHGAEVVMAIRDDGIRDIKFLPPDTDEQLVDGRTIADDQETRLRDRVEAINRQYAVHGGSRKQQRFLSLHIDFREDDGKHVDFDVYHLAGSDGGRRLAAQLRRTIAGHYDGDRLGGREFVGRIVAQPPDDSFLVLRETAMPAVLVELANIGNASDQLRFIVIRSRQEIAELLCEGLLVEWRARQRS